jgi:hypothetical protein
VNQLTPKAFGVDHPMWICREDFGIERNQSPEKKDGNAQFSLCCTSTKNAVPRLRDGIFFSGLFAALVASGVEEPARTFRQRLQKDYAWDYHQIR